MSEAVINALAMVAKVIGSLATIGGFLLFMWKVWQTIKVIFEGQKCILRSDIMSIYYKHCDEEEPTLREYERKNLDCLYESYEAHHGNTFVSDLYNNDMRHWRVVS